MNLYHSLLASFCIWSCTLRSFWTLFPFLCTGTEPQDLFLIMHSFIHTILVCLEWVLQLLNLQFMCLLNCDHHMIKLRWKRPQYLVHHKLFGYLITIRSHGIHQLSRTQTFSSVLIVSLSCAFPYLHTFLSIFPMPLLLFQLRKYCWRSWS